MLRVFALVAVAEVRAGDALLEALTVLLLAVRLSAIASPEVTLLWSLGLSTFRTGFIDAAVARLNIRHGWLTCFVCADEL